MRKKQLLEKIETLEKKIEILTKENTILKLDYSKWDLEWGWLLAEIQRNVEMHKVFYIDTYIKQLQESTAMIKDSDLEESLAKIVENVYSELSPTYIELLTLKYANGKEALLQIISDSVYMDVLKNASEANKNKFKAFLNKRGIDNVNKMNSKIRSKPKQEKK